METIDIVNILKICSEYLIDPTNQENEKQFKELKSQIINNKFSSFFI